MNKANRKVVSITDKPATPTPTGRHLYRMPCPCCTGLRQLRTRMTRLEGKPVVIFEQAYELLRSFTDEELKKYFDPVVHTEREGPEAV